LFALGIFVWLGANQIALESTSRQPQPHLRWLEWATRLWPILLGVLPIGASALSQYLSIPANVAKATAELGRENLLPGSAFYQFDEVLAQTVGDGLRWSSLATMAAALLI